MKNEEEEEEKKEDFIKEKEIENVINEPIISAEIQKLC